MTSAYSEMEVIKLHLSRAVGSRRGRFGVAALAVAATIAVLVFALGAFSARKHVYIWPVAHLRAPATAAAVNASAAAVAPGSTLCVAERPSFAEVAALFPTDKTQHAPHHYEFAYQALVAPRRCSAASMLEIGLGCGMGYGPGHSVPLWLRYMPAATISIFEFDYPCLTNFLARDPIVGALPAADVARLHFFSGDQSDPDALLLAAAATGPYDIIVDDGGHTMLQQIVSLSVLLPHIKPGGVYVLEDLATSFEPGMADLPVSAIDFVGRMLTCLHASPFRERTDAQHLDPPTPPRVSDPRIADACELARLVESISCWEEVCVFARWAEGAEPQHWRGIRKAS